MSFSLDDAKEAAAQTRSNNLRENDAGIPQEDTPDFTEITAPITKLHPECLITFDRIVNVDVFNTTDDFLDARQNLEHAGANGYGNDVVITVENPTVQTGEVWAEDHGFRDLRILGDPTDDASPYERRESIVRDDDGEITGSEIEGVSLGMGGFDGSIEGDDVDAEYIQFFFNARRAAQVLGQLDTAGKWAFDPDTGEFTEGIIEAPPALGTDGYDSAADADGAPRAIGYPELRADMVNTPGAIALTFDDEDATTTSRVNIDFFKVEDDELVGLAPLTPEDEFYALPTYPRAGNVYWDHDAGVEDVEADAEPSTTDGVADAQAMMEGESSDGGVTYETLSSAGQEFVDEAAEKFAAAGYDSVEDYDDDPETATFEERYATVAADGSVVADRADLKALINERL